MWSALGVCDVAFRSARWKGFVGLPLALGGVVLGLGGVATVRREYYDAATQEYHTRWNTGGFVLAGAGLAITALGSWLIYGSVVEDQPGSGVQWHPQDIQAGR